MCKNERTGFILRDNYTLNAFNKRARDVLLSITKRSVRSSGGEGNLSLQLFIREVNDELKTLTIHFHIRFLSELIGFYFFFF